MLKHVVFFYNLIINFIIIICQKQISFNFNILPTVDNSFESFFQLKFQSTDQLCIGTPDQCFSFFFDPTSIYTWVIDSELNFIPKENLFNPHLSESLRRVESGKFTFPSNKISEGIKIIDRLSIGSFNSTNLIIVLVNAITSNTSYPAIGLQLSLPTISSLSFLEQLYQTTDINSLEYTFDYLSPTNGRITFGYDNYSKNYASNVKPSIEIMLNTTMVFAMTKAIGNQLRIGNVVIKNDNYTICFEESFGFIQFPIEYINRIMSQLFDEEYKLYCTEMNYDRIDNYIYNITQSITYFICNKKWATGRKKNSDEVIFGFDSGELSLRKEDLFIQYNLGNDDKMLLTVLFSSHRTNSCYSMIGMPIMKYYSIRHYYNNNQKQLLMFYLRDKASNGYFRKSLFVLSIICLIGGFMLLFANKHYMVYNLIKK